jgi:hypothetical protein
VFRDTPAHSIVLDCVTACVYDDDSTCDSTLLSARAPTVQSKFSLSRELSLSRSLVLSFSLSLFLSFSFSFSLFLALSHDLALSASLSLPVSLSLDVSLSVHLNHLGNTRRRGLRYIMCVDAPSDRATHSSCSVLLLFDIICRRFQSIEIYF